MDEDVVTIFCCGTASNRQKIGTYAVPFLYDECTGRKFILDGPGGAKIPKSENVMKAVESGGDVKEKLFRKKRGAGLLSAKYNQAYGLGSQDNVIVGIMWLWEEFYKKKFKTINLVGWSRGGVTCIMLAHAIQAAGFTREAGNLRVNIFAFDPVPGGKNDFATKGDFDSTGRVGTPNELPPCVTAYRSIVHENIKKKMVLVIPKDKNFVCVVPKYTGSNSLRKEQEIFPMPGGHADSCTVKGGLDMAPMGRIGLHLAQQFLMEHGTKFAASYTYPDSAVREIYADIRLAFSDKNGNKLGASKYRENVVGNAFRKDRFYVNSHHAGLIETQLPTLAAYLAGNAVMDEGKKKALKQTAAKTYNALVEIGLLSA